MANDIMEYINTFIHGFEKCLGTWAGYNGLFDVDLFNKLMELYDKSMTTDEFCVEFKVLGIFPCGLCIIKHGVLNEYQSNANS